MDKNNSFIWQPLKAGFSKSHLESPSKSVVCILWVQAGVLYRKIMVFN